MERQVISRSLNRRTLLTSAAAVLTAARLPAFTGKALAQASPDAAAKPAAAGQTWRHGLSLFGDLKYQPGFAKLGYVNADAPKGGSVRLLAVGTFDNFNEVVSGLKGNLAAGIDLLYDRLLTPSLDEVSSEYGLLAESLSFPDDFSSAAYRLRPEAKWHDGTPVTPEDVIFSLVSFKRLNPRSAAYYRHVVTAEKTGEREVTFVFDAPGNRELPQIVGQLAIMPKHWWEGTDADGKQRDIGATTLEKPLGSGPYRLKEFSPGRSIAFERVRHYWGNALNVNVGRNNFDELRFEYFRDTTVALEAFKADAIDWRTENTAKNWATAYDFPAVQEKRVVLEEFPIADRGIMQCFAFNIRRAKFADPRLRRAFNYALDFEEMNKKMFFGQYSRIASYFSGTELASSGLPEGRELALLETVRDKVPAELFKAPYTNPVGGSPEAVHNNLRAAMHLLREAGYEIRDQQLVDRNTGEPFTVEFLADDPSFERVFMFFKPSLDRLGMTVTVRTVDDAQYENRLRSWDFDIITMGWGETLSPGNEQRGYWGSEAADQAGSMNVVGIKNPAVDALIERVIFAKTRVDLVAATHALDRVLLWNNYVVPQWSYPKVRSARWDRFGRPDVLPKYGASDFPTIWWWDADKAAKIGTRS
jgi:microcin C transport system substrate-binding protein